MRKHHEEKKKVNHQQIKRWITNWKKIKFFLKKLDFSQHAKLASYVWGRDNLVQKKKQIEQWRLSLKKTKQWKTKEKKNLKNIKKNLESTEVNLTNSLPGYKIEITS